MAYAYCQNTDCSKDRWWLTKPPSEYAGNGPSCPECGSTRVEIGGGTETADTTPTESQQTAREPAEPQPRPEQQTTTAPDTHGQAGGGEQLPQSAADAAEAGSNLADLVAGLGGGSPEEQADATEKVATAGGAMLAKLGQRAAQQQRENANRAKNATQDNISRVDDYVSCPSCDAQITDLPPAGQQFRCPGCGELLESEG